jgi:hypothetical protein
VDLDLAITVVDLNNIMFYNNIMFFTVVDLFWILCFIIILGSGPGSGNYGGPGGPPDVRNSTPGLPMGGPGGANMGGPNMGGNVG